MAKERPVVLLAPPPSDPTQPYSSLPVLAGYLRKRGFTVVQRDLGVEMLDAMLSRDWLTDAFSQATGRASEGNGQPRDVEYMNRFCGMAGWAPYLIENVEAAKRLMRSPDLFYDLERYRWANAVLTAACDLASLPFHPTRLHPSDLEADVRGSFASFLEATQRGSDNLFMEVFEQSVVPDVLALDPLLVGISATYHFQLVGAFTLGRLLKAAAPELQVVMGGAVICQMASDIISDPACFAFANSFVVGEGETALLLLAREASDSRCTRPIPNTVHLERGYPEASGLGHVECLDPRDCPDFDGLETTKYFSPEPVLLVPSARGCYWGKCAFCNVSISAHRTFRSTRPEDFCRNVKLLHDRYGARRFIFADDAIPLSNMAAVSTLIQEDMPEVTWQGEARFERAMSDEFLRHIAAGGCRHLIFGLESVCQRVLDLMSKGTRVKDAKRILASCARHGIAVNLQAFIGFPTETVHEARQTINFLLDNERHIAAFGFGVFSLYKDTPVFTEPERYGVKSVLRSADEPLLASCEYVSASGMTPQEASALHDQALKQLRDVYAARCSVFGDSSGAHSLLQFSRYDPSTLYRLWKKAEEPFHSPSRALDGVVPAKRPESLLSPTCTDPDVSTHRVFCTQTGKRFDLTPSERGLLELCDGRRTTGEIASIWADRQTEQVDAQVPLLARAFATINDFLRNGVLEEVVRSDGQQAAVH